MDPHKRNRLQYILLWMMIAVLWGNQIIHAHYEHQEHQQLHSHDQQLLQMQEEQLEIVEGHLRIFQKIAELMEKF